VVGRLYKRATEPPWAETAVRNRPSHGSAERGYDRRSVFLYGSGVATFDALLTALDLDNYRRGKEFERLVEWFLRNAPEYQGLLSKVWLWDDWPDRPSRDLGIDLVAEARDGSLWAIQAKAYAAHGTVTKADIDSFLSASASRSFSYRLLIAA
jgi:predicted helicase